MKNVQLIQALFLVLSVTANAQTLVPLNAPFTQGQPLQFAYSGGTGSPLDWIGIYQTGQVPGNIGSTVWQYVPTTSGQVEFAGSLPPGQYDVHLFCCDVYDIIASYTNFTVYPEKVRSRLTYYKLTDSVRVTTFQANIGDEVRLYHASDFTNGTIQPNAVPLAVAAITSVDAGQTSVQNFGPMPLEGAFEAVLLAGNTVVGHDGFEARPVPTMPSVITRIGLGSCGQEDEPQPALENLLGHDIDFFLYLGDNLYIDTYSEQEMLANYESFFTNRTEYQQLRSKVPVLATWDDHDYGCCDEDGDYPLKVQSQGHFLDFYEEPINSPRRTQQGIHTSYTFGDSGQRLQVILLDTRYFLDDKRPNNGCGVNDYCPWDSPADSSRTMLGAAQWDWLKTVLEQPADLRLVVSSVQYASSYHGFESWRLFPSQHQKMQMLIKETGAEHLFFVSGDMHYSEVSRQYEDPDLYPIYDFTSSGINQSWPAEQNLNRVQGMFYGDPNAGLLEIDWQGKTLTYTCLDANDAVRFEHTAAFKEMEFGYNATGEASAREAPSLRQVPLPGLGSARLSLSEIVSGEVLLFDQLGRLVRRQAIEQALELELPGLAPGMYVAQLRNGAAISTVRVWVK